MVSTSLAALLLPRLQRCLQADFLLDTLASMCAMMLLPWDKAARLVVHSWPYQPDMRLLLGLVAQMQRKQEVQLQQ